MPSFQPSPPLRLALWLLGIACSFALQSCGDDASPTQPFAVGIDSISMHWAEEQLARMSPEQKVAQLIILDSPSKSDSTARISFADSLAGGAFGGMRLDTGNRDSLRVLTALAKSKSQTPPLVLFDAGLPWSDAHGWPTLRDLGTLGSDSIASAWGQALAAEAHYLGAQACIVAAARVAHSGTGEQDALGASAPVVARLGQAMVEGMGRLHMQVCLRAFPAQPTTTDSEGLIELMDGKGLPLRRLAASTPGIWLQSADWKVAAVDSLPLARSETAHGLFLRKGMRFGGLVFSPHGGDAAHLLAGADMLMAPQHPGQAIKDVLSAIADGRKDEDWLDAKVRNVLIAKARMGLHHPPVGGMYMIDPHRSLVQLDRAIARATMVVLRDQRHYLPLGEGIIGAKVATVACGLSQMSDMQVALEEFMPMEHFLLNPKLDSAALATYIQRFSKYSHVVLGIHPSAMGTQDGQGALPSPLVDFLHQLDRKTKLVVVDFAGTGTLEQLADLHCLTYMLSDRGRSAYLAGQALMGAFPVTTVLPDSLTPSFKAGAGIALKRKLRFEYTAPEDLGISTASMDRIDSLVEDAIKKGVFPGCQVLAAKDGRVFLHKAYGYHDYDRNLRVRNEHLYDIASVSKIAATTLMAMAAFDADTLILDKPLKYFLPELDSSFITIKDITPFQLLTHSAGLPAGVVLNKYFRLVSAHDSIRSKIYSRMPDSTHHYRIAEELYLADNYQDTVWNKVRRIPVGPPGEYLYSDLSMYLMKAVLEKILGTALDRWVDSMYYQPMGLRRICYNPLTRFERDQIVPTEHDRNWRKQVLQGDVHDPTVAFLGGVGGPAGIFSNSNDLGIVMQMLLMKGQYGGRQYFKPETVELFTSRQPGSRRGLGFDMQLPTPSCEKGYCCYSAAPATFGHFGYTGTCAWADPKNQVVYVFLSNRVYPTDDNKKINAYRVRQGVQQLIYDALGIGMVPAEGLLAAEQGCYPEPLQQ